LCDDLFVTLSAIHSLSTVLTSDPVNINLQRVLSHANLTSHALFQPVLLLLLSLRERTVACEETLSGGRGYEALHLNFSRAALSALSGDNQYHP
jgi:hypothetical protein